MQSRAVWRWILCAALSVASAAAYGSPRVSQPEESNLVASCGRANFVFLDTKAKSVLVTGTFTKPAAWASGPGSGARALISDGHGAWMLRTSIAPAARTMYKFILDGEPFWSTDPFNPVSEPDGLGGMNSMLGTQQTFVLNDPTASTVLLTGSFTAPTAWAATEASGAVVMRRSGIGGYWVANVNLPVGRTLYKFIVDGGGYWVPDPLNPDTELGGTGYGVNSVITICRAR